MDMHVLAFVNDVIDWFVGTSSDPGQNVGQGLLKLCGVFLALLILQYVLGTLLHDWKPKSRKKRKREKTQLSVFRDDRDEDQAA